MKQLDNKNMIDTYEIDKNSLILYEVLFLFRENYYFKPLLKKKLNNIIKYLENNLFPIYNENIYNEYEMINQKLFMEDIYTKYNIEENTKHGNI